MKHVALFAFLLGLPSLAVAAPTGTELYTMCSFYPASGVCEKVYKTAAADEENPTAASALAEYRAYARWLTPNEALTAEDRSWLSENAITLPDILTAAQEGGLHALLADQNLKVNTTTRKLAVENYLSRALQAHLYCALQDCNAGSAIVSRTASGGDPGGREGGA